MKLSLMIETLQQDLELHGDVEVVYSCECFENIEGVQTNEDGIYGIGGFGWYANEEKGETKIMLICAECHHQHQLEHIRGKYE